MEITVTIPPNVEEHLRTYAASLFYETSSYALSRAVVCALINEMDAARLINKDSIVMGILEVGKPLDSNLQASSVTELLATSVQKPDIDISVMAKTDPQKLKIPREQFHGDTSNTWLVWGWCISFGLSSALPERSNRKARAFSLQDVIKGVIQQKGIQIKDTTAYSALNILVERQWLTLLESSKRYTLSAIAQQWALASQNQTYLIEKGFLTPPV